MDACDEIGEQAPGEGFIELSDGDALMDDADRIVQYRAVALAEGLKQGTEAEVLWAWQWLGDHPEVTTQLQGWFARRVAELRAMGGLSEVVIHEVGSSSAELKMPEMRRK